MNSAESFGRSGIFLCSLYYSPFTYSSCALDLYDDDPTLVKPATAGIDGIEDEEKKKYLGKKGKMFRSHGVAQGFCPDSVVPGRSWYGTLYKGTLKGQREVVIKLLRGTDQRDISRLENEAKVLSQMHHRNVVQLLGRCDQVGRLALVFEFVPNGVLYEHLNGEQDLPPLPWKVRYWQIAVGLASALLYLQEGLDRCVVHRGITPFNVLLDSDFNPKLADFGLAIVAECGGTEPEFPGADVAGTTGYLDPYYNHTRMVSKATDIYSFGVVALQIARSSISLDIVDNEGSKKNMIEWVEELHEKGTILEAVDPKFRNEINEREVERLLLVGLWCTQWDAKSRPSIKLILQLLNFEVPMPTRFGSNISRTLIEHGIPSSPDRSLEEPKVDIDATTASTKSRTERYTFKDVDANELPLVLVQDNQADEPERALTPEDAVFNIGIPPDFTLSEFKNQRKDHHRYILMGFAGSLREMMQSKENLPTFDEALEKIRMYTTSLVQAVGPPLDDWNTLAQLVLRTLKERDDFFEFCTNRTSLVDNITMLSLNADMRKCAITIDEDRGKLKECKELLARALEKCASLEAELAKAQEISLSIAEQVKAMEQRITENLSSLEREGHCALSQQYEHVLSTLSAFNC